MLPELHLSVKRSKFRVDDPASDYKNAEFLKVRPLILDKQDFTCYFCSFKSSKFQEVHHLNDDHGDNREDNLVVICPLCHSALHIGLSGRDKKGTLIYIDPELGFTQPILNQIMRHIWIGEESSDSEIKLSCSSLKARLYKQSTVAKHLIESTELSVLSDYLLKFSDKQYSERINTGLLFYPYKEYFEKQHKYWKSEVFKNIDAKEWVGVTRENIEKWTENKYGNKNIYSISKLMSSFEESK